MVIPDYVVAPPGKRAIEEVAIMGDNFNNNDTYSIAIEVDAYNRKFFEDFEGELMYYLENYPGETLVFKYYRESKVNPKK